MNKLIDKLSNTKVLVVGDTMLDRYWWGNVSRISPEAPVPVVRLDRSTLALGGAANVALNVKGLGAEPILIGCSGADPEADQFASLLLESGISDEYMIRDAERLSTIKTRVIAHSQQVARVDQETTKPISAGTEAKVVSQLEALIGSVDSVIVSDYAKGFLTDRLLRSLFELALDNEIPVLVDPKGKDYSKYSGATLLTPNRKEAAEACNIDDIGKRTVQLAGEKLLLELDVQSILITEGEDGMTLFSRSSYPIHIPTSARKVYDVTGAGDTVIAVLASAVGSGTDLETSARLANLAAGIVVEEVGTTAISAERLAVAWADENRSNESAA